MKKLIILISFLFVYTAKAQESNFEKNLEKISNMSQDEQLSFLESNLEVIRSKNHFSSIEYQESLELYNAAISINSNNELMYAFRANFFLKFREFDKAIKLSKNDTLKLKFYTNRGAAKSKKRDFKGAYKDLINAYKIDSTNVGTLVNLGAVSDEIGKKDETIFYLKKAIQIDSTCYPAYGNLGFQYQEAGNYNEAIKHFNKVLELVPNEPLGYSNRAYNKMMIEDLDGALLDINKSISIYPENSYAYMVRALILIEKKELIRACLDISKSLDEGFTEMYGERVKELKKTYCND